MGITKNYVYVRFRAPLQFEDSRESSHCWRHRIVLIQYLRSLRMLPAEGRWWRSSGRRRRGGRDALVRQRGCSWGLAPRRGWGRAPGQTSLSAARPVTTEGPHHSPTRRGLTALISAPFYTEDTGSVTLPQPQFRPALPPPAFGHDPTVSFFECHLPVVMQVRQLCCWRWNRTPLSLEAEQSSLLFQRSLYQALLLYLSTSPPTLESDHVSL